MLTTIINSGKFSFLSISLLASSLFFFSTNSWAETKNWQKELKKEIVKVSKGKMTITEYEVCKLGASSIQIKTYSEAPSAIISRDNFVALTAVYSTELSSQIGDLKCKDIDAPIGSVDVEILLYMTNQGIKMELQDRRTNTKNTETVLWSDIFATE